MIEELDDMSTCLGAPGNQGARQEGGALSGFSVRSEAVSHHPSSYTMTRRHVRSIRLAALLFAGVVLALAPTRGVVTLAQSAPEWTLLVPATAGLPEHAVFVPRQLREASGSGDTSASAPVLIALHGMGDSGPVFAAPLLARAEQDGMIVLA